MMIEEGDEWECPPCWERCEAQERAIDSDQLAWDRFAAAALNLEMLRGMRPSEAARDAAMHADAMMIERAKRLAEC